MEHPDKPRRARKASAPDALTVSVERAGELLGISRASAYEAVNQGHIPHLRFGRRLVVPRAAIERLLTQAAEPKP